MEGKRSGDAPVARRANSRWPVVAAAAVLVALLVAAGVAVTLALDAQGGARRADDSLTVADTAAQDASPSQGASGSSDRIVMTLGGSADTYVLVGEDYLEAGCHAVDRQGGDVTASVQTEGDVDTSKAGDYEVVYTASADDGTKASASRTVHVVESFDEAATSLPVLMYHYIYTADDQPETLDGNYLLDTDFEAQLQYLSENGYYYPSYQEVKAFAEGSHTLPAKSVVLTFDDGERGFLSYGIPLLEKYRIPGTSFIICSDEDAAEKIHDNASPYVQFQSHSYAMHQAGSNVGRGGRIHAMTQEEIVDDLRAAQGILGTTEAFAYPFGDVNEDAQAAVREAGVLCAFTIINDRVYPGDDPTALNRVRISGEYSLDSFVALVS